MIPSVAPAGGFMRIISKAFLFFYIILILFQVVVSTVQQKSIEPVIKELGGNFLFVTQSLSIESKSIIDNGGILYDTSQGISGFFVILQKFSTFFTLIYTIIIWVIVLKWIVGHSPFSNTSNSFRNLLIAIILFLFLQSCFLITTNAISKNVDCFSGCEKSIMNYTLMPITWTIDFFKALPYIFKPIKIPEVFNG